MQTVIAEPRVELSQYAPKIVTLKINPDKIRDVIGPSGKQINKIIEDGKLNNSMKIWIPTNISNSPACKLYSSIGAEEPEIKDDIIYNFRY